MQLRGVAIEPIDVKMDDRDKLKCKEVVRDMKINMQRMRIALNLHVLPLVGLDMVFGNVWLKSTESVFMDFKNMTMEFKLGGKKRTWTTLLTNEIKQCDAHMMEKLYNGGA